jgi:hypothetical protein
MSVGWHRAARDNEQSDSFGQPATERGHVIWQITMAVTGRQETLALNDYKAWHFRRLPTERIGLPKDLSLPLGVER